MSGGYVRYNGVLSPLLHKAPGSLKERKTFTPGIWELIEDETDYKWYEWKAQKTPEWSAKRRLADEEKPKSRIYMAEHQPLVDRDDPAQEQIAKRRALTEALEKAQKELNEFTKAEMMKGRKRGGK